MGVHPAGYNRPAFQPDALTLRCGLPSRFGLSAQEGDLSVSGQQCVAERLTAARRINKSAAYKQCLLTICHWICHKSTQR